MDKIYAQAERAAQQVGGKFILDVQDKMEIMSLMACHQLTALRSNAALLQAPENELQHYLDALVESLTIKMALESGFFQARKYMTKLYSTCRELLNDASCIGRMPARLRGQIRTCTALVCLLNNSGYGSSGFIEGCALLAGLHEVTSESYLTLLRDQIQQRIHLEKELKSKCSLHYALAVVAYHQKNGVLFEQSLNEYLQLARREGKLLAALAKDHNPEKDFPEVSAYCLLENKVGYALFLYAYFTALADGMRDENERVSVDAKAAKWLACAYECHPFYCNILLGRILIKGTTLIQMRY